MTSRVLNSLVPALLPTSPLIYARPCSLSSTTMTFLLSSCLRAFAPVCPECVTAKSSLVVTFSGMFSGHWSEISTFNQTSQLLHCFIFPCSTYHYLPYYVFYLLILFMVKLTTILNSWETVQRIKNSNHTQILPENRIESVCFPNHFSKPA